MRRASALSVVLALLAALPLAAQSGPASRLPAFRAGMWAARFELGGAYYGPQYYGVGALRFTSSRTAWTASVGLTANYFEAASGPISLDQDRELLQTALGRRWYQAGHSRVRPFGELGVRGFFIHQRQKTSPTSRSARGYGAGGYAALGAAIFFAPELSLGASWTGGIDGFHDRLYDGGVLVAKWTSFSLGAGTIHLDGAFYF